MNRTELLASLKLSREATIAAFNCPAGDWEKSYAPGKWTVRQILVHLADVELVHLWRYSRALAEPGSRVHAFDHDGWVTKLRYDDRPMTICRDMFTGNRDQILYYLEAMPESSLDNTVDHSESGVIPASRILNYLRYHTDHHLEQIQFARNGRLWTPAASAVSKP